MRHGTAVSAAREAPYDLAVASRPVMAVEVAADVNLLQTFGQRPLRLIVRPADIDPGDAGFIDRNLFGHPCLEPLFDLGEPFGRNVGPRRFEDRLRRLRSLRRRRSAITRGQSLIHSQYRDGDPMITRGDPRAEILVHPAEILPVVRE